ncbi:MAG TPA: tRNA guanosine(34) transglycosylase Tgt [Thermodesulfobacteriota bacterium]|nr:tRNA guanosine(34) transglycosylase Tgt [Thermodesulfobacteriota bacterium]HNU72368.1 tRNA guanosine(34) transglycosylase Tgt [Thermodesulfobacteriota bacterium]HOC39682.1 tRNA guanosine(34) transglycosylase Tgt [Thermodesulfobacteriota bacterium]
MSYFTVTSQDSNARTGKLVTPHGDVETPAYLPVATHAVVKALSSDDLLQSGVQALIANTYHLHLQPGETLIARLGGLHQFMRWPRPLITDSGGFQALSLGAAKDHGVGKIASTTDLPVSESSSPKSTARGFVEIHEPGIAFTSHLDGTSCLFSPEAAIAMQRKLGADVILVLDECTSPAHGYGYTRSSLERTHRWAMRALTAFQNSPANGQALWAVVQGGVFEDLRRRSASFLAEQPFDGFAIGGALGSTKKELPEIAAWTVPFLPVNKPRHLLGMGEIEDVFAGVHAGIDAFDCILPTLLARTGTFLLKTAPRYRIHILNAQFRDDPRPIDEDCFCPACTGYSRAYLRHLFAAREPLGVRLAGIHNIFFMESLMREIRRSIQEKRFEALYKEWMDT